MKRLQRADRVFTTADDDSVLMMSAELGRYFDLNNVGARIWELLELPTTQDEIVRALLAEYDIAQEPCAEEVTIFLAEMRQCGLIHDVD